MTDGPLHFVTYLLRPISFILINNNNNGRGGVALMNSKTTSWVVVQVCTRIMFLICLRLKSGL